MHGYYALMTCIGHHNTTYLTYLASIVLFQLAVYTVAAANVVHVFIYALVMSSFPVCRIYMSLSDLRHGHQDTQLSGAQWMMIIIDKRS